MVEQKYGDAEMEKYANPDNWEIWKAPDGEQVVYHSFPEFTCLCPRSGYPDFATVHLIEVPDKKVLELKVLKLWLNSYRDKRISHENATQEIFDTLWNKLEPKALSVAMEYTPRGNLTTFPTILRVRTEIRDDTKILLHSHVNQVLERMIRK